MNLRHLETMAKFLRLYDYTEAGLAFRKYFNVSLLYTVRVRTAIINASELEPDNESAYLEGSSTI